MKRGIYFEPAQGAQRPRELSTHAIERFIERWNARLGLLDTAAELCDIHLFDADGLDRALWDYATSVLGGALGDAWLISWEPRDLDGLGQGVWGIPVRDAAVYDGSCCVRIVVDGNGLVRTTLPPG